MPTITVPRVFGGTLIIQYTLPTIQPPLNAVVEGHKGTAIVEGHKGTAVVLGRKGTAIVTLRKE